MTKDEWVSWTQLEATRNFLTWLETAREEAKESWARGHFTGNDINSQATQTAAALGGIRVIDSILNKEYMDE